jgi:hypothetical protein
MSNPIAQSGLDKAREFLEKAEQSGGRFVFGAMASLRGCAWCDRLIAEQLQPRQRAKSQIAFDFILLDLRSQWARELRYRVAPTFVMVGRKMQPITEPLVGYASTDFYSAYLEDAISQAARYWKTQTR